MIYKLIKNNVMLSKVIGLKSVSVFKNVLDLRMILIFE